jgi:hypothetical protein
MNMLDVKSVYLFCASSLKKILPFFNLFHYQARMMVGLELKQNILISL